MKYTKSTLNEYQRIAINLKVRLKQQNITYEELAKRLDLSVSGVKKILSAKDGSIQRVAQICDILGVSFQSLVDSQGEKTFEVSYSKAQQEYLMKDQIALKLYWALAYERRKLNEMQELLGIKSVDLFSKLRKLDQLKLLQLLPGDKVKLPPVKQIKWIGDGPLIQKLYREWSVNLLRSVVESKDNKHQQFIIRYFRASKKTIEDLMTALHEIETEFVRRAISEMRTEDPSLLHLRWVSALDNRSYIE